MCMVQWCNGAKSYLDQEKNSPEEYNCPRAADRSTNRKLFNYEKLRDLHPLSLPFATFSVKSRFFMFFCALFTREQEEWTTKNVLERQKTYSRTQPRALSSFYDGWRQKTGLFFHSSLKVWIKKPGCSVALVQSIHPLPAPKRPARCPAAPTMHSAMRP